MFGLVVEGALILELEGLGVWFMEGLEEEGIWVCGLREENSGLSWLCREDGMEITGDMLKAFWSSLKANGQSTNLMAIAKQCSYEMREWDWLEANEWEVLCCEIGGKLGVE